MLWTLLLLLCLIGCTASISCTGKTTFCRLNENCYLSCKSETNVTLVRDEDGCSGANVLYTNTTGNIVRINASAPEEASYACCSNKKKWICSSTVIVSHEAKDVTCIWDLKDDEVLSCSVAGIPDDAISNKFNISMSINFLGLRPLDKDCTAISKFVFTCPLDIGYQDSEIDIYVTMVNKADGSLRFEQPFKIIPIAKHKELIIEVDKLTSETCTLNLTLQDDHHFYLQTTCSYLACSITIEISYTDPITNNHIIESHNRITDEFHVPSINMTNLRPNTLHTISVKWKIIEDKIWSHIAMLNFTTKVGVPKTSPLVLNKAKSNEYVGIYIKERSEDFYYGPISLVLNKTTPVVDGQKSRRSLPDSQRLNFSQTVFVKYDETGNESVTLQYATSAGISSQNSKVFISPQEEVQNVNRLIVKRYNRTHDSLTIDNIDGVERLHFYWCYGEFSEEKQLVDCKSIEHVELKDVKNTSYVKRAASDDNGNCTNCKLHYGVAVEKHNKTSSILWDAASEPLKEVISPSTAQEASYLYLYILLPVLALLCSVVLGRWVWGSYKKAKKVPLPTLPRRDSVLHYDNIQSFTPDINVSSETESNLTDTTRTISDSDQSDIPVIPINSSTSDQYPKITILS